MDSTPWRGRAGRWTRRRRWRTPSIFPAARGRKHEVRGMSFERVGVIGAGAWGTALSEVCARAGRQVVLWAREPEVRQSIAERRENGLFLPGVTLSETVSVTGDFAALAACDLVLAVPPAQFVR